MKFFIDTADIAEIPASMASLRRNAGSAVSPNRAKSSVALARTSKRASSNSSMSRAICLSSSVGAGRSAMEPTDLHAQEEDRFLRKLADRLDAAVNAGEAKSLILVAPPRALGVLRQTYSHNLRTALRAEIDKDLVKLPVHEIERHLAA